jgi:hypothetical protein
VSTPTLQKASGGQLENNYAPWDRQHRQKGMPKPESKPTTPREPGRGDAPERARQVSRTDPIQQ